MAGTGSTQRVTESHVGSSLKLPTDEISKQDRRTSSQTHSTGSTSNHSKGKETPLAASQRKRNGRDGAAGREVLMGMIAQEMTNAWEDDEVEESFENNVKTAQKSAEDIYYARMNGEAIDDTVHNGSIISGASSASGSNFESPAADLEDDEEEDFPDHCSFAGLNLHAPEETGSSASSAASRRGGRKSSNRSKGSSKGSKTSKTTKTSDSKSRRAMDSETELTAEEIQNYAMEHIPQALKDQIPQEAWGQIFGDAIKADKASKKTKTKSSPSNSVVLENLPGEDDGNKVDENDIVKMADEDGDNVDEDGNVVDDDDGLSVLSDITEGTNFCKKKGSKNNKIAPLAPEEGKWEMDIDPALAPSVVQSSRSHPSSGKSMGSFSDNRSRASNDARSRASNHTHRSRTTPAVANEPKAGDTVPIKVSFHVVQVRYYERILDINPSVTAGPPVGIGWRFKKGGQVTVDEWELQRGETRKSTSLVLPRHVREAMLKESGYTNKDIADVVRLVMKAKNQRRTTVSNLNASGVEEAVERAARRVKGLLNFRRNRSLIKV